MTQSDQRVPVGERLDGLMSTGNVVAMQFLVVARKMHAVTARSKWSKNALLCIGRIVFKKYVKSLLFGTFYIEMHFNTPKTNYF